MKNCFFSISALIVAGLSTSAYAQPRNFVTGDSGWYWSVGAGATIPQDGHITEFGPWSTGQKISYEVGGDLEAAVGFLFNKYVAAEFQTGGTWNYFDSIEGASIHDTTLGTVPILANLILQYPIPGTRVVPYIGGGAGGAGTFFDTDHFFRPVPGGSVSIHGSDSDFEFAWQGMAGLRLDLNPQMSLGVGYRFLHVDGSRFGFESHSGGPDLEVGLSSLESHIVALTFQMRF